MSGPELNDTLMRPMPRQLQFDVLGLQLAAQRWHPGGTPVIALHGWLDNSDSFTPMAAFMADVDLLAVDLAGHGWSSHRVAHAGYLIWDDIREILAIADAMGWQRFGLLGHSRGAIIAGLLAAVVPERIRAVGLIDGFWAQTCEPAETVSQMARSLASEKNLQSGRVFETLEQMISVRLRSGFPLSEHAARLLVNRNAEETPDGSWRWRTDPRHKVPSMIMLSDAQQKALHQAIAVPVELALANEGMIQAYPDFAERLLELPRIDWSLHAGGHHLHMEGAQSILGPMYNGFFQRL